MRLAAQISKNFTKNLYFESSRSLKVIDVDNPGQVVTSFCYDKQHCLYATVFMLDVSIA